MGQFHGEFEDESDVIAAFDLAPSDLEGCTILFAAYERESYDGAATVLFERDGQWFEADGSHCSCYGLEGQWRPTPVTVQEVLRRIPRDGVWGAYWAGFAEAYANIEADS